MSGKLYIKTFGCQMNERDSEIIEQLLYTSGYITVSSMDDADFILLNTCSIRAKAEQKVYSLLGQLRQYKIKKPELLIGVAGCVAQQEGAIIQQRMPHVDLVVGTQQLYRIPELLKKIKISDKIIPPAVQLDNSFSIPPFQHYINVAVQTDRSPPPLNFKKFVTIMQGCNNYCSYCVVPYTRGREISRPVADILKEVNSLVSQGIFEITLLGQNVNSYGQTNNVADKPINFPQLLYKVASVPGLRRLRFTTSNPKDLSDELMQCFKNIDVLCPQFHLPVQSGSDRILKLMNRKYSIADYLGKVDTLLQYRPDIALSTDIIIGFPGESDVDFEATMDLLNNVRFHSSFSFKYSDRPGTRSAGFNDKVEETIKSERLSRFQARQDEISLERNKDYVGREMDIVVDGQGKNDLFFGRTVTNHIVHFPASGINDPQRGDIITVRINIAGQHSLTGNVQKNR